MGGFPDGFFRDTPNIKRLYLYGTGISRLDARTFGPLGQAMKLRLEDCQITSIAPDTFRGWSSLTELNLRGNALRRLEAGTFRDTTRLHALDLRANRLTAVDEPPRHNQWMALRLSQAANGDDKGEGEAPCVPLGGFGDAEGNAAQWAASCFKGNEGMVRCVEREWATAGGRWEAPLARLEQKLKRCRKGDDPQRQEGAMVVRDAAPPGGDRSAGSAFRAASPSSERVEGWAAAMTLLLVAGLALAAGRYRQARRRRGQATTWKSG